MATFKERDIFEYCERFYNQSHQQDNGYFPNKHDKLVFQEAAKKYGIGEKDVEKLYDSYTKLEAKAEMMRINRLPKAKRKAAMMRKMQDIMLNNKDLPFCKTEGEPSEPLPLATDIIEREYKDTVSKIAQAGRTIPLTIDVERVEELRISALNQTDIDNFFAMFYSDEKLDDLYELI